MLSIVTVNRNDAEGLRATGESIARQTSAGFEWLIVDGGSDDGSLDVIRALGARVSTWSSAPDVGVYDAMNKGLARAEREYVVFMNAGDRFADPGAVAAIIEALGRTGGPDLLFGGALLELPSGRRIHRPPRPAGYIRFGLPACHQATVFRRTAHLAVPYALDLPVSADYGAVAALLQGGARSATLERPIAIRRCHRDSLSERRTLDRLRDVARTQQCTLGRSRAAIALALGRLVLVDLAYRTVTLLDRWAASSAKS